MKRRFFTSFSGGKDCNLAHHLAIRSGLEPVALLSTISNDSGKSMSHAIPDTVIRAQANALGLPLIRASVTWESYEQVFKTELETLVKTHGVTHGVFGDIDIEDHRKWEEGVCEPFGVTAVLPLWQMPRIEAARAFVDSGFEATIIVVNTKKMPASYAGKPFNHETIERLIADGIDPCGEAGEFHTLVTNGPTYQRSVDLSIKGTYERNGYFFMDFGVTD